MINIKYDAVLILSLLMSKINAKNNAAISIAIKGLITLLFFDDPPNSFLPQIIGRIDSILRLGEIPHDLPVYLLGL
ncbi:MAG: hypothetical protein IJL90_05170, partial [Lachnospiraceae bacterium]|nr:hypothetical protein [Lachnospiraceae bacterium]